MSLKMTEVADIGLELDKSVTVHMQWKMANTHRTYTSIIS